MKEIEILVDVLESKESALKKLEQFHFVGKKSVLDIYFSDPLRINLQPDKEGRLNNCFRVRTKDEKTSIAYKVDHFTEKGEWTYSDEHETEVGDFEIIRKIIEHLGFEILLQIDNEKNTYITDDYEVVLEDVKDLGIFLEVERLKVDDTEDISEVKKEIWNFIQTTKIKVGKELNAGKPELMLKKKLL